MMKKLAVIGAAGIVWSGLWGCDQLASNPDVAKLIPAAKVLQAGDVTMDQTQLREQLRDGTGTYCPGGNPDASRGQGGQGNGDRTRARDGSCLP